MKSISVQLTKGAEHDLVGIYQRRLRLRGAKGEDGADALLNSLVKAIESLLDFPERGPVPPELDTLGIALYRQLSLSPYRIIYELSGNDVTVMVIADSRRDFRTLLEERLLSTRS